MQNSETQIKKIMTTFSCTKQQQTNPKRLAPIAPSSRKIDLDDEDSNQQQELLIKVPLMGNKMANDPHLSLLSSSSCSSNNNQKEVEKKFSSSSTSSSTTSSKIKANIICSTISSVSSPSTGSTSSSSNESVIISTSSPPSSPHTNTNSSSKINSPRSFYQNNLDGSNSFEEVIIDLDHREMAIDCPDGFTPQFKTRPVYPPVQFAPPPVEAPKTTVPTNQVKQSSIIKPLLTILGGTKNQPSLRVVENPTNVIEMTTTIKPAADLNPLSCSFSSIQFIDDDAKSRTNLNDTTTTLTTPLVNKENLLQLELTTTSPSSPNSKPSLGKRLFEKQQQKLSHIESSDLFKFGAVNSGFEMEEENKLENDKTVAKTRAPTPPNPNQPNFTCINIIDSATTIDGRTNKETFVEVNSTTMTSKKQREIINNLDLIEQKINQTLAQQLGCSSSSTPQISSSSSTAASEALDQSFDNICKSCQSNINYLRKLIKPDALRNAIDVGYLVLELNEKHDFRPSSIAAESSCLADEVLIILFILF